MASQAWLPILRILRSPTPEISREIHGRPLIMVLLGLRFSLRHRALSAYHLPSTQQNRRSIPKDVGSKSQFPLAFQTGSLEHGPTAQVTSMEVGSTTPKQESFPCNICPRHLPHILEYAINAITISTWP